jgi:hypothetical protein
LAEDSYQEQFLASLGSDNEIATFAEKDETQTQEEMKKAKSEKRKKKAGQLVAVACALIKGKGGVGKSAWEILQLTGTLLEIFPAT